MSKVRLAAAVFLRTRQLFYRLETVQITAVTVTSPTERIIAAISAAFTG